MVTIPLPPCFSGLYQAGCHPTSSFMHLPYGCHYPSPLSTIVYFAWVFVPCGTPPLAFYGIVKIQLIVSRLAEPLLACCADHWIFVSGFSHPAAALWAMECASFPRASFFLAYGIFFINTQPLPPHHHYCTV